MNRRKICIVTGTRAEWGLLSGIASALRARPDTELQIVATNMHLDPRYGHTVDEITSAGFHVDAAVPMSDPEADDSTEAGVVKNMSRCLTGMADAFTRLRPDMVVILGDRTEMLAVASAATVMLIPIVHLHGGEVTEGAIDDAIRHAITKMAALHLVSTESHRRRVIQMGEDPEMVVNTGAIGVWNALHVPAADLKELSDLIGFTPDRSTLLVTYHPATLDAVSALDRFDALTEALDRFPELKIIFTYPNNDALGAALIERIRHYASARKGRVSAVPSLGMRRFMTTLDLVGAVAGNSSSGIIEVPSKHIPTIDIGIRQRGRTAAESVIHCGDSADEIADAIRKALSPEMKDIAARCINPYEQPDTLRLCVDAIAETPLEKLHSKKFHDFRL